LRGAEAPGDLSTFTPYPMLTVVNFGKILSNKSANHGRQAFAGRRSRANLYFAAIFEIDRWSEDYPLSLLDAVAELDLCPEVADFDDLAVVRDRPRRLVREGRRDRITIAPAGMISGRVLRGTLSSTVLALRRPYTLRGGLQSAIEGVK
jgi:hypothetical protein